MAQFAMDCGFDLKESQLLELVGAVKEHTVKDQMGGIALSPQPSKKRKVTLTASLNHHTGTMSLPSRARAKAVKNKTRCSCFPKSTSHFKKNNVLVAWFIIYVLVNIGLITYKAVEYKDKGTEMIIGRASAIGIYLNVTLSALFILRHLISLLRKTFLANFIPLDEHITIHKFIGKVIFFLGVIHTAAHIVRYARSDSFEMWEYLFTTRANEGWVDGSAGITGVILIVLSILITFFSISYFRRNGYFELFHWVHHLAIAYWVTCIFHAPNFWKWFVVPGQFYVVEFLMRASFACMSSRQEKFSIADFELLPSKVTKLKIKRPESFTFSPGDYVFINIPHIAKHEWHPFTISSAPEEQGYFTVHIRSLGNWTTKLHDTMAFIDGCHEVSKHHRLFSSIFSFDRKKSTSSQSSIKIKDECNNVSESKPVWMQRLCSEVIEEGNESESREPTPKSSLQTTSQPTLDVDPNQETTSESIESDEEEVFEKVTQVKNAEVPSQSVPDNEVPITSGIAVDFALPPPPQSSPRPSRKNTPNATPRPSPQASPRASPLMQRRACITGPAVIGYNEITSKETPYATPQTSARTTPVASPYVTPATSPRVVVRRFQGELPDSTPYGTPLSSPQLPLKAASKNEKSVSMNEKSASNCLQDNDMVIHFQGISIGDTQTNQHVTDDHKQEQSTKLNEEENCQESPQLPPKTSPPEDIVPEEKGELILPTSPPLLTPTHKRRSGQRLVSIEIPNESDLEEHNKKRSHTKLEEEVESPRMFPRTESVIQMGGRLDTKNSMIYVDGPYGSPSSAIFNSKHAILIAAGIGVTPFASILQCIMHRYKRSKATCPSCCHEWMRDLPTFLKLQKVDFVWINSDVKAFEWFISILGALEKEQQTIPNEGVDFLSTHLFLKGIFAQRGNYQAARLKMVLDMSYEKHQYDVLTGLKTKLHTGAPNWDKIFGPYDSHPFGKPNVFFCGPAGLAQVVMKSAMKHKFGFRKENF